MARPIRTLPWYETREGIGYAAWYDPQARRTRRVSLRTRTAEDGRAAFAAFLAAGPSFMAGARLGDHITVGQVLDDYDREHAQRNVVDTRRSDLVIKELRAFFGSTELREVDVPMCHAYAAERRSNGLRNTTIARELRILSAAAAHAKKWKRIGTKVSPDLPTFEFPKAEEEAGEAPWLTKAELAALLDEADGRLRDFIVLAYYSASRREAILQLEPYQANLATARLSLAKRGERKTKKRRPIVPIFPEMREPLERRIREAQDGFLFGRNYKVYVPFNDACVKLGFGTRSHPHILRHSRATHLLMDNVSIYAVAKLLGDTVATVERNYGHHSAEFLAQIGAKPGASILESNVDRRESLTTPSYVVNEINNLDIDEIQE